MWRHHVSEKKLAFLLFDDIWLKILPQLNIKAAHNFKQSLGIILTQWAESVPIFPFILFLVSEVVHGEQLAHFCWVFFCIFWHFLQNATIKKLFFQKSKCAQLHIILVLDAIFVLNLTFLGLFIPDISFGEKTVTHSPSLFRHRTP